MSLFPPTGIRVEFDLSKPPQHRVKSLSILCTKCRVPIYEPVENEMVYKVVLPSYMVTGGDGFSMIKDGFLKHNSGEAFVSLALALFFSSASFHTRFFCFQGIWTFQSCQDTSHKEKKFIPLSKDASSCTTQLLDLRAKQLPWFLWFHSCFSGVSMETSNF